MREYSKQIKRLIREYAARAYEAELGRALGELDQQFAAWRNGQISAFDLSDHIHVFHQGPARELWSRYNARIDDTLVAHAIVTGLLPRESIPAELLEAIQPILAFYERDQAEPKQGVSKPQGALTARPCRWTTSRRAPAGAGRG